MINNLLFGFESPRQVVEDFLFTSEKVSISIKQLEGRYVIDVKTPFKNYGAGVRGLLTDEIIQTIKRTSL